MRLLLVIQVFLIALASVSTRGIYSDGNCRQYLRDDSRCYEGNEVPPGVFSEGLIITSDGSRLFYDSVCDGCLANKDSTYHMLGWCIPTRGGCGESGPHCYVSRQGNNLHLTNVDEGTCPCDEDDTNGYFHNGYCDEEGDFFQPAKKESIPSSSSSSEDIADDIAKSNSATCENYLNRNSDCSEDTRTDSSSPALIETSNGAMRFYQSLCDGCLSEGKDSTYHKLTECGGRGCVDQNSHCRVTIDNTNLHLETIPDGSCTCDGSEPNPYFYYGDCDREGDYSLLTQKNPIPGGSGADNFADSLVRGNEEENQ